MCGVMLVLLATLRSTNGRKAILDSTNNNFEDETAIHGWILLLEVQLQIEAWLKQETFSVSAVIRLRTKIREVMELTKTVGKREKGMRYKTNNFHATKHVPDDILMFGPPHSVNTRSCETHHKKDKKTALITQKRPSTFDFQCSERVEDRRVLEMGMLELNGKPRWDYFRGFQRENQLKVDNIGPRKRRKTSLLTRKGNNQPILTGVRSDFWYDEEKEAYVYKVFSSMKRKKCYQYPQKIVDFVADLAESFHNHADNLPELPLEMSIFSELQLPTGQIFRACPFYQGKSWYDWAMCRVGEQIEGFQQRVVPAHIRGFVDLQFLPAVNPTKFAPKLYLICETTRLNPDIQEIEMSDLLVPFLKEEGNHGAGFNKMVMLPVENIVSPVCVIPDLGHPSKRAYFRVRPVEDWGGLFEAWLNSPFAREHQEPNIGE